MGNKPTHISLFLFSKSLIKNTNSFLSKLNKKIKIAIKMKKIF